MLTSDRAQPILHTADIKDRIERYRRLRDERRAGGQDVSGLERDIALLKRVLKGVTRR